MKYFETRFLEDADKFIAGLDLKTVKNIFYNIDIAEQTNDPKLLRNFKMIYGNFGQSSQDFKSDFLHFGTKQITKKPW